MSSLIYVAWKYIKNYQFSSVGGGSYKEIRIHAAFAIVVNIMTNANRSATVLYHRVQIEFKNKYFYLNPEKY